MRTFRVLIGKIGYFLIFIGGFSLILSLFDYELKILNFIYQWGEGTAIAIKIGLIVVGAVLSILGRGEEEAAVEEFAEDVNKVLLKSMIKMMMADGHMDDEEVNVIKEVYESMTNEPIDEGLLQKELKLEAEGSMSLGKYIKKVNPILDPEGKMLIVKALVYVALADGVVHDDEMKVLRNISGALEMPEPLIDNLIAELQKTPA